MTFTTFIGIDYSGEGAAASRLSNLQVYSAAAGQLPQRERTPRSPAGQGWNWTREEIADWLVGQIDKGVRFLAGIDHAFSFPESYLNRYGLQTWDAFLDDFQSHWPADQPRRAVEEFRANNARTGTSDEFRLTEEWTSSAKSVFLFGVNGSVAKSSHAGIPWLRRIRRHAGGRVHFWPFDGWALPTDKSVIAEVYPSIFRHRYDTSENAVPRTGDQQDAYSVARWLSEAYQRGILCRYLDPPLTPGEQHVAAREGWILGVA